MDKNRIIGPAKQAQVSIKDALGKPAGDAWLPVDGKTGKTEGNILHIVGAIKDSLKS